MAVIVGATEENKELARWEMFPSRVTIAAELPPGNPYREGNDYGKPGAAYPKMLYRAQHTPGSGKWAVSMEAPRFGPQFHDEAAWNRACQEAERFAQQCQLTVNDEQQHQRAHADGWRDHPDEAVRFALSDKGEDARLGQEAGERNYRDRNMSEKAKAESAQAEAGHFGHLPAIPEKPITRRKRRAAPAS